MRILVTAGPTREYFDTVRFISNPSTGKMGYAIAIELALRGHDVVLISGPVNLPPPEHVEVIHVESAEEMFQASTSIFETCHAAVMTAAVCDYRPARRLDHKLKKQNRPREIRLKPTRDILAHLGRVKGGRVLVGFAMEDHDHRNSAERKLRRKNCDAIVLNGIDNVGSDRASVEILRISSGWSKTFSGTKRRVARVVADLVEDLAGRPVDPERG